MGSHPGDSRSEGNLKPNKPGQRPKRGRPKDSPKNRAAARNKRDAKFIAQNLTSNPVYRKNLLRRLQDGTAGPIENLLWLYAHDKPKERRTAEDLDARLMEIRKSAIKQLKKTRPTLVRDFVKRTGTDDREVS